MNTHSKLIIDLKNSSYNAFEKLYDIYADLLYGFVLGITKSPSESKDILQETFLRIWINREKISLDYSFKSYLYKIAKNLILNSYRKQIESIDFENYICSDEYQANSDNNIEREIYYDEFKRCLELAKLELTERQREIFELSREYDLSIDDIAQKLNLSEQTVKNHLSISLKILRGKLTKYPLFVHLLL